MDIFLTRCLKTLLLGLLGTGDLILVSKLKNKSLRNAVGPRSRRWETFY